MQKKKHDKIWHIPETLRKQTIDGSFLNLINNIYKIT